MAGSIQELREEMGDCHRCALGDSRTNLVFGVGNPNADIMFIGEAPGYWEDLQGEPFVGKAGKLLDQLLAGIGLDRSKVYIANVLKCRPPNNRDPQPEEIDRCRPFLREQVRLIAPRVICTLGNFSTKLILDSKQGITKVHGQAFDRGRFLVYPLYHPAAALRTPAMRVALETDFVRIPALVEEAAEKEDQAAIAEPFVEQMNLFDSGDA